MWNFEYKETAEVDKDKVWEYYSDVKLWPEWDDDSQKATLYGEFKDGEKGTVFNKDGSKTNFILADVEEGKSYTMVTGFAELGIQIAFTHKIVPSDVGRYDIIHGLSITGQNSEEIGKQLGTELTKNFAKSMDALLKVSGGKSVK